MTDIETRQPTAVGHGMPVGPTYGSGGGGSSNIGSSAQVSFPAGPSFTSGEVLTKVYLLWRRLRLGEIETLLGIYGTRTKAQAEFDRQVTLIEARYPPDSVVWTEEHTFPQASDIVAYAATQHEEKLWLQEITLDQLRPGCG